MEEKAFGIAKVEGKYNVIIIQYDANTGEAKVLKKIPNNTLAESIEQFKIEVGHSHIFSARD
jgi:hypothetical protein